MTSITMVLTLHFTLSLTLYYIHFLVVYILQSIIVSNITISFSVFFFPFSHSHSFVKLLFHFLQSLRYLFSSNDPTLPQFINYQNNIYTTPDKPSLFYILLWLHSSINFHIYIGNTNLKIKTCIHYFYNFKILQSFKI